MQAAYELDIESLTADNQTVAHGRDVVVNLNLIFSQLKSVGRDSIIHFSIWIPPQQAM